MTTTAPAKPRTTFSQEYIVARIEARIASLKSRVAESGKKIDRYRAKELELAVEFLGKMTTETDVWSDRLDNLDYSDQDVVVKTLNEFSSWAYKAHDKPILSYQERQAFDPLWNEHRDMQRELDLLDHAYAYVKESTIEEYTITSLSRLGLLDIVKFVLTPDAADRAKKRGRR